jgi:hypothetical protein
MSLAARAPMILPRLSLALLAASMLVLPACAAVPEGEGTPEEEVGKNDDAISGSLAVGSTLIATTDVNLRSAASTSASVLHVVPSGASVTVVAADPQSGFYNVKYNGSTGWSYGAYYKAGAAPPPPPPPPPPPGATVSAADLLAVASNCHQLSGTTKFSTDSGGSKTVPICGLTGAVWWKADMDVDCDGGKGSVCQSDPDYQSDTAGVDSKGHALDASTLPYVVIPMSSNGFNYKTAGLKMGSVVAVIYNGKVAFGILGDVGPAGVIGEASYAMAVKLGINPSPISGGVDSGVTYVAFTGTAAAVTHNEDSAQAASLGAQLAHQLIQNN